MYWYWVKIPSGRQSIRSVVAPELRTCKKLRFKKAWQCQKPQIQSGGANKRGRFEVLSAEKHNFVIEDGKMDGEGKYWSDCPCLLFDSLYIWSWTKNTQNKTSKRSPVETDDVYFRMLHNKRPQLWGSYHQCLHVSNQRFFFYLW